MFVNFSKIVLDRLVCLGVEVFLFYGCELDIYILGEVGGIGGFLKLIVMVKMGIFCGCMGWKSDFMVGGFLKFLNL